MLAVFHVAGKIPFLREDLKIRVRGSVMESPHNGIIRIEILSAP